MKNQVFMKKKVVGGQYYTFYANEIKMHASEHFKRHPPYIPPYDDTYEEHTASSNNFR